jgi:hypothetical protein
MALGCFRTSHAHHVSLLLIFSEAALRRSTGSCSFLFYSCRFGLSARFLIRLFALDKGGRAAGAW